MAASMDKREPRTEVLASIKGRRVGLVLGAGGATGMAFHAGTLLALHTDLGWDPRSAAVIVGTSAGSVVATLLRSGFDVDDVAAWGASVPSLPGREDQRAALDAGEGHRPRLVRPTWSPARSSRIGKPGRYARRMLLASLPNGLIDASAGLSSIGQLREGWPDEPTWITAVRRRDAARVVFGRDRRCDLGDAVAASCAIPGLFTPVRIDDTDYVDGGVHSPTNADVLSAADVDVALVLSPMSIRRSAVRRRLDHAVRLSHKRQLWQECKRLRNQGIHVVVFEPEMETLQAMGVNSLDRERSGRVVRSAFLNAMSPASGSRPSRPRRDLRPTTPAGHADEVAPRVSA